MDKVGREDIPIENLLTMVENGEIKLPDIQREFVWTNPQVKHFVESIYKKLFETFLYTLKFYIDPGG